MCTLLLWKREHPRYPLIAAANRDEYLDRPSTGPRVLGVDPRVVGGRDEIAGGTWFAVNADGLIVALTNRRGAGTHDPARRSRGVLVTEIARSRSFAGALKKATDVDANAFNPFVLFIADRSDAAAVHAGFDGTRAVDVANGAHAITNWELDATAPSKAARALRIARAMRMRRDDDAATIASALHAMLADHGAAGDSREDEALCVHRAATSYGTRSSTIAFLGATPVDDRLFYAEGPPCTAVLGDYSALLRDETGAPLPNDSLQ